MRLSIACVVCLMFVATPGISVAQAPSPSLSRGAAVSARLTTPVIAGTTIQTTRPGAFEGYDQDDPAYAEYKAAYKLVIEEKWEEARKKLQEVAKKYPKSKYVDDAKYWYAYSLRFAYKDEAIAAYKAFLKQFPSSNYYDDAVADLQRLQQQPQIKYAEAQAYAASRAAEQYERAARLAVAGRERMELREGRPVIAPTRSDREDPKLRMRIEALYALARSKNKETFGLLQETVLDTTQPQEMREAALYAIRQYQDEGVWEIYSRLARGDGDKRIQVEAIHGMAAVAKDSGNRANAYSLLKQIALDRNRDAEARRAALDALRHVSEVGEYSVLAEIARTDPDKRVQEFAIYCLGQADRVSESKRLAVLKEIALDRSRSGEVRAAALRSILQVKRAVDEEFYLEIAKNEPDRSVQETAIYAYFEATKDEPAKQFKTLRELLLDRSKSSEVRQAVMHKLAALDSDDAIHLLVQLAKTDPDEDIQVSAIYQLGRLGKKKEKMLETLIGIFESTPTDQRRSLENLMFAIANIGSDKAVDFLARVAKTGDDYELRRRAVSYLGNIGGEKARSALVEILREK